MTGQDVLQRMYAYFSPAVVDKILDHCKGDKVAQPFVSEAQQTNINSELQRLLMMPFLQHFVM